MPPPVTLRINGSDQTLVRSSTVAELVDELALAAQAILIEHNGTALHRSEWPATPLAGGDRIEILRVVAGG